MFIYICMILFLINKRCVTRYAFIQIRCMNNNYINVFQNCILNYKNLILHNNNCYERRNLFLQYIITSIIFVYNFCDMQYVITFVSDVLAHKYLVRYYKSSINSVDISLVSPSIIITITRVIVGSFIAFVYAIARKHRVTTPVVPLLAPLSFQHFVVVVVVVVGVSVIAATSYLYALC